MDTLFDFAEQNNTPIEGSRKLDIVQMEFIGANRMSWEELFEGFDDIKVITFSSGIQFVFKLLSKFKTGEIIFGCEDIISFKAQEIMAFQIKLIEKLQAQIPDRIKSGVIKGDFKFYAAHGKLSHEKIYLLNADDGRRRVVYGSANMSSQAFEGRQRENIGYFDGERAYEYFLDVYNSLRDESTGNISQKALETSTLEENLDELPIAKVVAVKKVLTLEPVQENTEEVQYIFDVNNLAKKLTPHSPKAEKGGKVLLSPEIIVRMNSKVVQGNVQEKEMRSEYPELIVNVDAKQVTLNGKELDLKPEACDIERDVELFLRYMEGFSSFHGDYQGMQYRYYEFANWFFASPFMSIMRDMATRTNRNTLPYPVYGLLYGKSKAGKTSFLETILKMMIGQKPKLQAVEFTRTTIDNLKKVTKGAPIIVDDLTNARFGQHAIETIKNDGFGVNEGLINYPAVVISANEDVKAVAPEVIRRTVICRVSAGLTNTEVMKSNAVRTTQQKIGTAFYREYLRRMLECVPTLIEEMKDDEIEMSPDLLSYSSKILYEIFKEFGNEIPEYIRELSLEDYFSEQVTGQNTITIIQNAWRVNKKAFRIDKRNNELRYNAGQTYDAERFMKELPETLDARRSNEWVIMLLDKAKEFFGIDFKKGLFK
ncbi:MAG: phospholipase D family protein [Ruminococcus sp.]